MYHYGAGTNVGNVRDNNEDSLVCDDQKGLWIVADGMGGLGFGEVASAITTYTVTKMVKDGHGVNQAIEAAHQNIKEYAETDGLGTNMGTTIVLLLSQGSLYNIFWVGDSRAYLFHKDKMRQITIDHSLVQTLIDQGELTREEAETDPRKNAVTRALGVQELETVRADSISDRWQPGQKILLCSDGLTDCVTDSDIEKIMQQGGEDQEIVDNLIEAALEGGGKDNVTIVVVSAPATAKIADVDTHVPGNLTKGDDTLIPSNDDTLHPKSDTKAETDENGIDESGIEGSGGDDGDTDISITRVSDQETRQLALDIAEPEPMTANVLPEQDSGPDLINAADNTAAKQPAWYSRWHTDWYNLTGAIAACVFLSLAVMSMNPEDPATSLAQKFVGKETSPVAPLKRNLPEIDFSHAPTQLQIGLFKNLKGAETQQSELTSLGLSPDIVKRVATEGVMYAVVISPLDETEHKQTMATLQANNLNYFHARRHGT